MYKLFAVVLIVFLASCRQGSTTQDKVSDVQESAELQEQVLHIGKMHCEMCVASVEKGLRSVEGVEFVKASLADSTAVVRYDALKTDTDQIGEAIEKRGYVLKNK